MQVRERYVCKRCTWEWFGKTPKKPRRCPECNSPYWDKERTRASSWVRPAKKRVRTYRM